MIKDLIINTNYEKVFDILDIDYTNSFTENLYVFNAVKMTLESDKRVYLSYNKNLKYYTNIIKIKRTLLDYIMNTCSIIELKK